jgi:hypothetical protein
MQRAFDVRRAVDERYRAEWGRILATLIGLVGDFELAEEAAQEGFAAALQQWESPGCRKARARGWSRLPGTRRSIGFGEKGDWLCSLVSANGPSVVSRLPLRRRTVLGGRHAERVRLAGREISIYADVLHEGPASGASTCKVTWRPGAGIRSQRRFGVAGTPR